jgi:uncharacterized membrane protein
MRRILVALGAVLVVVGLVLTFLPAVQAASQSIGHGPGLLSYYAQYNATITGISITGSAAVTVAWSANASVTTFVATCSVPLNGARGCPGTTNVIVNGSVSSSGSNTFSVPDGGYFAAVVYAPNSTVSGSLTVTIAETTIGLVLFVLGILLLILGVVLRAKPKPASAATPAPTPTAPPVP